MKLLWISFNIDLLTIAPKRYRVGYDSQNMRDPEHPFELHKEAPLSPKPLPLAELTKSWEGDSPKVSILCPTYQHVSFIRNALDGFLSQVTTFPFEVIVRDDASTDGTQDILREYASNYPGIMRLLLEEENRWHIEKPLEILLEASRGEFVAICEGDDYWFDPHRLQRLFDVLKVKPDASLVEDGALVVEDETITGHMGPGHGGLRTWLLRTKALDPDAIRRYSPHIFTGDRFIEAMAEVSGKRVRVPGYSSIYRQHSNGIFTGLALSNNQSLQIKRATSRYWISIYLREKQLDSKSALYVAQAIEIFSSSHPLGSQKIYLRIARRGLRRIVVKKLRLAQVRRTSQNLFRSSRLN